MDFRYARPPPPPPQPPSSDPHQPPPQQPVPPPPGPWYSGQFQYHSPSPPPPQWAPQSQHSDYHLPPPYAAAPPPPMPYSSNPYPMPPRPHMPPPPPHYPPVNQEWGHQGWNYSAQNKNEDDLAARARAWAASKAVTDDQHQHTQLPPANRPEEMNYQEQYSQNTDPQFQQSLPPSNYQQYSSPYAPPPRAPAHHLQEPSSFNSGYATDGHFSYNARDGNVRDLVAAYPHQENAPTSLSVHQQEVPSSYSSVAGKEDAREMNGKFYQPSHMPYGSAPNDRSMGPVDQPHYAFSNASVEPTTDPSNQPLDFGPRFGHDHDPFGQSVGPPMPSVNPWTSSGLPYPPMPPQADSSMGIHSPASMHSAPLFGRTAFTNPTFPVGPSNTFHTPTAFPGETYGTPGFPERPKKASVPNWLREEIIKKKAVIGSAVSEISRHDHESNEDDEDMDRSIEKEDQVDRKSFESSRSTEEDDDDEDYVEAARTAAINQEIKRILTEVLLKVTDELFDEIATKVMEEDDLKVEVERKSIASSDTTPAIPIPKSSAKILIPAKSNSDEATGKSNSSSPGDVLGLGNYASDDDEDDKENQNEIQNPSLKNSKPTENGSSQVDEKEEKDSHGVSSSDNKVGVEASLNDDPSANSSLPKLADESQNDKNGGKRSGSKENSEEVKVEVKKTKKEDENGFKEKVKDRDLVKNKDDKDRRSSSYGNKEDSRKRERSKDDRERSKDDRKDRERSKDDRKDQERSKDDKNDRSKDDKNDRLKDDRNDRERSKDDRKDRERSKDDKKDRERERSKDDKNDRERSKHKRRYSPLPGGRGRGSKDNSYDNSSDDSRRKVHSRRRDLSPSPVRSRRQVSRSPPTKRSQRRHSNYSSLDTTTRERKRSRSRSRSRRG